MRDVVLISPPHASVTQPYLSLPSLTAYLRRAGYDVRQHDTSPDCFDLLLSPTNLAACLEKVRHRIRGRGRRISEPKTWSSLSLADSCGEYIVAHIEEAKAFFRKSDRFFDENAYTTARNILERGMELVSAAHPPLEWRFNDLNFNRPLNWAAIHDLANDENANPFARVIRSHVLPHLLCGAAVYGLSVTYHSQIVPAFTFARWIKAAEPAARIVVGGAWLTARRNGIIGQDAAFRFVDAFVFGEGETPLCRLVQRATTGEAFPRTMPSVHLPNDGKSAGDFSIAAQNAEDFDALPTPDYDGLDIDKFFSPEPALLLSNARGCYWRKCAFCAVSCATGRSFRQRTMVKIKADIDSLLNRFGTRHLFFADDCIPPKRLREIAEHCRRRNIFWQTEARYERGLTPKLLETLWRGGCRQISFGNESGNQRVLDLMAKGTDIARNERIIQDCHEAGIAVQLQNFIGFPSETEEEAKQTADQLVRLRPFVTSFAMGQFHLQTGSPCCEQPALFGLSGVRPQKPGALESILLYDVKTGLSRHEATDLLKRILARLMRAYPNNNYFFDGPSGAHISFYLARRQPVKSARPLLAGEDIDIDALLSARLKMEQRCLAELPDAEPGYVVLLDKRTAAKFRVQRAQLGFLKSLDGERTLLEAIGAAQDDEDATFNNPVACAAVACELARKGVLATAPTPRSAVRFTT